MNIPPAKTPNLRADAAWVVFQILEQGKSSRDCLSMVQQRHSPKDRAWLQEMSMGVLRQLPQLQLWMRQLLDKPLKGNKKIIEHLIMLGLYQLTFSRVSAHAAVAETVNATEALKAPGLKGLVNAVLRNFQRQGLSEQRSEDPRVQAGLPKWLHKMLVADYPERHQTITQAMNTVAPIWLRVNRLKISREDYLQALTEVNIEAAPAPDHPDALILHTRTDIPGLPGFDEGWFAVQDGAAQLAAPYLQPAANERILDCCAAPGGKTGHLLELQPALAHLLALDFDEQRLARVSENMQRLQHQVNIQQGDASNPDSWWDGQLFDRILLDAPCSATGVIRRHPDIRWLRNKADIEQLVSLQATILEALWPTLKPGGTLLYATCSVLRAENTGQMRQFLARHSDASLQPLTDAETPECPGRQILPGEQQMDGFYYCRLIKSHNTEPRLQSE